MHFWLALSPNTKTVLIVSVALLIYAYVMVRVVRTMASVSDWYEDYNLDLRYVAILAEVQRRENLRLERKEERIVSEWWEQDEYQIGVAQVAKEFNLDWYGHGNEVEQLSDDPPQAA